MQQKVTLHKFQSYSEYKRIHMQYLFTQPATSEISEISSPAGHQAIVTPLQKGCTDRQSRPDRCVIQGLLMYMLLAQIPVNLPACFACMLVFLPACQLALHLFSMSPGLPACLFTSSACQARQSALILKIQVQVFLL